MVFFGNPLIAVILYTKKRAQNFWEYVVIPYLSIFYPLDIFHALDLNNWSICIIHLWKNSVLEVILYWILKEFHELSKPKRANFMHVWNEEIPTFVWLILLSHRSWTAFCSMHEVGQMVLLILFGSFFELTRWNSETKEYQNWEEQCSVCLLISISFCGNPDRQSSRAPFIISYMVIFQSLCFQHGQIRKGTYQL